MDSILARSDFSFILKGMLGNWSPVRLSHILLQNALQPGDIAVDATVGNGHDTRLLCSLTGPNGRVFGFDIQAIAIQNTRQWFAEHPDYPTPTLFHAGHETMQEYLPTDIRERIGAFIFNLGYLPGGDKQIITQPETSQIAMQTALSWLRPGGILVCVIYRGHAGGDLESDALSQWARQLPAATAESLCMERLNLSPSAPYVLAIRKTAETASV